MNLLKFLGLQKKVSGTTPKDSDDVLHLWEDDSLMIELLPQENIEFVKAETIRINDFGQEHFDGKGFSDITPIGEKPFKTAAKLIDISEITKIMVNVGLEKITRLWSQGVGYFESTEAPFAFGSSKIAIICETQNHLLTDIWITGHANTSDEQQALVNALLELGQTYNLIAVNWYSCEYFHLIERSSVEEFVEKI